MRKMKLFKGLCSVLIVFICSVLCMGSSCILDLDYSEVFESNWKVVLPENMKELFGDSDSDWQGKGIRYDVFKLDEEPSEFIEDFNRESNIEIENKVNKFLDWANFEIPEEYLPDWKEEYCWKLLENVYPYSETDAVIDSCYLIYFTDLKRLSICQYFA